MCRFNLHKWKIHTESLDFGEVLSIALYTQELKEYSKKEFWGIYQETYVRHCVRCHKTQVAHPFWYWSSKRDNFFYYRFKKKWLDYEGSKMVNRNILISDILD